MLLFCIQGFVSTPAGSSGGSKRQGKQWQREMDWMADYVGL
jgi:hypothetical protein